MRNNKGTDEQALKILKDGADAVKAAAAHNHNKAAEAFQQLQEQLDKRFAQLNEQTRMLQYALGNVFKTLQEFPAVKQQLDQLDYRTLGVIGALEKANLVSSSGPVIGLADFGLQAEAAAKDAREKAFWELSDSDDKAQNLTVYDGPVDENCWVILTTTCEAEPDWGVFRSKMDVGSQEFAAWKDDFLGKKIGDTVAIKLQNRDHVASILSVRKKPDASKAD